MPEVLFSQQIEAAQERLAILEQRVRAAGEPEMQVEALVELSVALEELQVAEEELQQQNDELLAARQLAELERERYQDLFNFAPDGYLVTDSQGVIREANRVAAILLQVAQKYLIGKPLLLFVAPEDRRVLSEALLTFRGEAKLGDWEMRLQPREGLPFYAAITVAVKRNVQGQLEGLRWLIRDMTERKRVTKILQENEFFNRAILNSLGAHIAVLDQAGTIIAVNEAWEHFAEKNSSTISARARTGVGVNYLEICRQAMAEPADDARQALAGIEAVLSGLQPNFSMEYPCHSPTRKRWFLLNVTRLAQRESGAVISHQNITQQKLMEAEKIKLLEAVNQQSQQLRALTGQLAEVQEAERKRLVQELHDRVGPNLTALGLNLNIMETQLAKTELGSGFLQDHLDDSMALLDNITEAIRNVMAELRPPVLDDYGLLAALKWYADMLTFRANLPITVVGEEPVPRLAPPGENALFRIAQEALTNVIKHAQATQVTVTLESNDEAVGLVIADNGLGFETPHSINGRSQPSWGLLIMNERAHAVGGRCWIESVPDEGTRVIATLPRGVSDPS